MDHGHDHGHDMPGNQCNMNMLFNWSYENLCIVFPSWHINSLPKFIFSLIAIIALTAGYEAVREVARRVEAGSTPSVALREDVRGRAERSDGGAAAHKGKGMRGALYAVQVFYSFFIMLLFMTYNGFVMLAVAVGAFVGYMLFGAGSATRTVACH